MTQRSERFLIVVLTLYKKNMHNECFKGLGVRYEFRLQHGVFYCCNREFKEH